MKFNEKILYGPPFWWIDQKKLKLAARNREVIFDVQLNQCFEDQVKMFFDPVSTSSK